MAGSQRGLIGHSHHQALRVSVAQFGADERLVLLRIVEQLPQGFARAEAGPSVEVLKLPGAIHAFSDASQRVGFNTA